MIFRRHRRFLSCLLSIGLLAGAVHAQTAAQSSSSSSAPKHVKKPAAAIESGLDPGTITDGLYRNKTLVLSCKIPSGWVLRTHEMNAPEQEEGKDKPGDAGASNPGGKVLLAAFSRPPEARGEEVNSSILIAAESVAAYPGLTDAAQYFGPLTEVAKAQGFTIDEEPYEIAVGAKTLVRADFHKDVGTRVMHQSTLAMFSHGYAVSITLIAGTEDEVEELIDGLPATATSK
jgi:hypothetical protein